MRSGGNKSSLTAAVLDDRLKQSACEKEGKKRQDEHCGHIDQKKTDPLRLYLLFQKVQRVQCDHLQRRVVAV